MVHARRGLVERRRVGQILPTTMPITEAMTVARPNKPLAFEISSGCSTSGMLPARAGENIALARPISATRRKEQPQAPVVAGRRPHKIAPTPSAMMTISASLQPTITERLGKRSARYPGRRGQHQVRQHKAGRARHQHIADVPFAATWSLPMPMTSQRKILSFRAVRNCVASKPRKPAETSDPPAVSEDDRASPEAASMKRFAEVESEVGQVS